MTKISLFFVMLLTNNICYTKFNWLEERRAGSQRKSRDVYEIQAICNFFSSLTTETPSQKSNPLKRTKAMTLSRSCAGVVYL